MKPKPKSPPAPPRKRIVVVDDHPLMREGVAQWIQRAPDLAVCGQTESAAQALSLVEKFKPDLMLTEISLTGRGGLELIKDLQALQPELPVHLLSIHQRNFRDVSAAANSLPFRRSTCIMLWPDAAVEGGAGQGTRTRRSQRRDRQRRLRYGPSAHPQLQHHRPY